MTYCPYHFQDGRDYCGPACLMMFLESQQAEVSTEFQSELWGELSEHQTVSRRAFATSPEAIAGLASLRLTGTGAGYAVYPPQTPPPPVQDADAMINEIRNRLLDFPDHPVFALIEGGGHWILIYDVQGDDFLVCTPVWRKTLAEVKQNHDAPPCEACLGGTETVMTLAGMQDVLTPVVTRRVPTIYSTQRIIVVPDIEAALP